MTEQEFDNIADEDLWQAVMYEVYSKLPDDITACYEETLQLNPSCQAVWLIWGLVGLVDNGGFSAYYCNPLCDNCAKIENERLIPTVLKLVGADALADICQRAYAALNENPDPCFDFESFDEEFYANTHDMEELMIQFIRKNKKDFID